MKNIHFHNKFWKIYEKLPKTMQQKVKERIKLFSTDSFHPTLNNHTLSGKFQNHRSINITGDYRAIYVEHNNMYVFKLIGTHSELYG